MKELDLEFTLSVILLKNNKGGYIFMKKSATYNIVVSAIFIAIGLVLPFFTGQIPEIGGKIAPMHIPVLISGFVLGGKYGLLIGFMTPILRSFLFGMPVMFPFALAMAFELAAYGFLSGVIYEALPKKNSSTIIALVIAMLLGRVVWGVASYALWSVKGMKFTLKIFMANGFINAVPGIILHILLIPTVVIALRKAKIVE